MHSRCWLIALCALLAACNNEAGAPPTEVAESTPVAEEAASGVASGEGLYQEQCGSCHNGGVYKAPHRMFLAMMAPDAILASMDGIMAEQSSKLSAVQKRTVAEHIAGRSLDSEVVELAAPLCEDNSLDFAQPPRQKGWGVDYNNSRFQPLDTGGLSATEVSTLELKWAFAYPNAIQARSQPTVAGGSIFVGSQNGTIYALDAKTGCARWTYRASAEVRTAVSISSWDESNDDANPSAYFGDILARAYAIDAQTGEEKWITKVDDHPNATITGAPVVVGDRLYVPVSSLEVVNAVDPSYECCTFRGSLVAIDTRDGSIVWKTYVIDDPASEAGVTSAGTRILAPSGAPIWNSPTVDLKRQRLYAGTGENYSSPAGGTSDAIIAFDMDSGKIIWVNQATKGDAWNVGCLSQYATDPANCPEEDGPDFDFAASSVLVEHPDAGDVLVAGQKSGDVMAIDPDTGKTLWRKRIGRGGVQGGVHFGIAAERSTAYIPINDMAYPEDVTRYKFTTAARPGMFALDAYTGEVHWENIADDICNGLQFCNPGISSAVTAIPGAVIAGHLDGRLRIYGSTDGAVLWEYDTRQNVETVSGEAAHGGSMSGGGPVVADGMLYVNSGYGIYFHMPGNVLLAFGSK
jgi:polyvinyl alcohol dehydrogenase (cytochrome)